MKESDLSSPEPRGQDSEVGSPDPKMEQKLLSGG